MMGELTNHLWQSTAFAAVAGLLTLIFRENRAQVRFALWFSASVKFLIPFSLLNRAGSHFGRVPAASPIVPTVSHAIAAIAEPFPYSGVNAPLVQHEIDWVLVAILSAWACGAVVVAFLRLRGWLRIRTAIRASARIHMAAPVEVRVSSELFEPGVVGLFRPILVLPQGMMEQLSGSQMEAVLAHELCHVRRRDNLTSTIQMAVESVFWFHPAVWWIGARLLEERERACDEAVLRQGTEPKLYAEVILRICKLYAESPVACVAGMAGADLKKRIQSIMNNRVGQRLSSGKKILLTAAASLAVTGPVFVGMMDVTPMLRAQSDSAQTQPPAQGPSRPEFEVASIKPSSIPPGGRVTVMMETQGDRFRATHEPLINLIAFAYNVRLYQISGAPNWVGSFENGYEIEAKARAGISIDESRLMLQSLLADRVKLKLRFEQKEFAVYELSVGKNGAKLRAAEPPGPGDRHGTFGRAGVLIGIKSSMEELAAVLSMRLDWPVLNRTGIGGYFDFNFEYAPDNQPDSAAPSIFTALREYIGLQLEPARRPIEILTVEQIEKPSAN